jgi:hypothetical protein
MIKSIDRNFYLKLAYAVTPYLPINILVVPDCARHLETR